MSRLARHCVVLIIITSFLAACAAPDLPFLAAAPTAAPTAAPATPTPATVALDATLRVESGGFSLSYPQGWHTRELSHTLALAASQAALDAAAPGDDLVVLIDSTPINAVAAQYGQEAVADAQAFFRVNSDGPREAGYTLGATAPITVDGKVGVEAEFTAAGGSGQLVVFLAPPQAVRILGQSSPTAWEAQRRVFEEIVASLQFFPPILPATPTPANQAVQPILTSTGPPGFVLRLGGNTGPRGGRFASTRGLAAAPDGRIYLAESSQGIWVFDSNGKFVTTFGAGTLLDAYDIARGPDGDLFVADYGRNAIVRLHPDGTLVQRWGEAGTEPDQFGLSAPQRIAVGVDGSVYALDSRIGDDSGSTVSSIIRFNGDDGSFIERIELPSGSAPNDLAVDAQGAIYLAETFGGAVVKINSAGEVLARLGENVTEEGIVAGALDLDRRGNIYVATWSDGILKFAPGGTLLARGGEIAEPDTTPQPGQFSLPNGIAVAPNGVVWVSDNSGEYSAVTALRLTTDADAQATAEALAAADATPVPGADAVSQWASRAKASSAYDDNYSARNATGRPDVEGCRDSTNAWASADPNGLETLELGFDEPVFATQVNIHQNHQPGFITEVELIDERGETTSVYRTAPRLQSECPYVLQVRFAQTPTRITGVKLTIDQRSGANWNEIDAVELIGVP